LVVDDTPSPAKIDAVFPNNWFSTHQGGVLMVYPMFSENRRLEVREDIVDNLAETYGYDEVIDWTPAIYQNAFLEGTGSLILDRVNKIAYACFSPRTHPELLEKWGELSGYKTIGFHAANEEGIAIYHTNVMMAMGENLVVIAMGSIPDPEEKETLLASFQATNKEIIDLSFDQVNQFAGNMLQVENETGEKFLVMSEAAYNALTKNQLDQINKYCTPLVAAIPTIEQYGGGSVRCMLAEIFIPN
ncbi:MAG: amidinotransferase, partial [Saprospiraceae bacterium]|nr:amidinotransferase [Saprospiraceae bacterium]